MDGDPGDLRDRISVATGRLLASAATLADSQARAPWSPGQGTSCWPG